jgi:hypothetical protein
MAMMRVEAGEAACLADGLWYQWVSRSLESKSYGSTIRGGTPSRASRNASNM